MKVAVIGGGIFGATAAIHAARAGHEVHLYEALEDVLQAASAINQYRLHRGYHYPRSPQTAASSIRAERSFREEYGDAVVDTGTQLYAIAKEGSRVSGEQFLAFCDEQGLPYSRVEDCEWVNPNKIELVIRAGEARFDPDLLREIVRRKLQEPGVHLHLNTQATAALMEGYEKVIIAGYAANGSIVSELTGTSPEHQYELCEKPVIELPDQFGQTSLVVMDGPFMCVDPIGDSNRYVLGNVVHAIHATNIGSTPEIPETLRPYVNRGIVQGPPIFNFDTFIETGAPYIPILAEAKYIGSMFTVRTVLPGLDATDARPTTVTALDDKYIKIFSGKIGNCVAAATEVVMLLNSERATAPSSVQQGEVPASQNHQR